MTCKLSTLTALLAPLLSPALTSAAEYWLRAEPTTLTMPDSQVVPMWGFALDADHSFATVNDGATTVPGPALTVPAGDTTLTVHLWNGLAEPTSLVISGLPSPPSPTFTNLAGSVTAVGARPAGDVTSRVRSFTTETAPGTAGTYTWNDVQPGTYLYQSGTHPAVQVQMGLYGAVTKDAALGPPAEAYEGIPYAAAVTLLYSEIDPVQHAAIAGGTFTSPIDYRPGYFLVNGAPYVPGSTPAIPASSAGGPLLVRFLNAGLETRVPMILGGRFQVVAEDGFPYRNARSLYAPNLPAGKTLDAVATLAAGRYPIFDRRLGLTNGGGQTGGMIVELEIAP